MELSYVLLTAARNEENYIRQTIESVVSQKISPEKWVIVSDGSTDGTDNIIKEYADKYHFIKYVRATDQAKRSFSSKAFALNIGYEHLKGLTYNFIGNLDADVTFNPDYYEIILQKFLSDNKLGIAGGIFYDVYNGKPYKITPRYHSVRGAVQLFNRKCYEDINLWLPLPKGGIDAYAEISARQHGWKARTFDDVEVFHHRVTGTASTGLLNYRFRAGIIEYTLGYHSLFQAVKCIGRISERPFLIGAILRFAGYCWASLKREKRNIPKEFFDYIRKEQRGRLKKIFSLNKEII